MHCSPPGSCVHGDIPEKNSGVGCHFLFQEIFLTQKLNQHLLQALQNFIQLRLQSPWMWGSWWCRQCASTECQVQSLYIASPGFPLSLHELLNLLCLRGCLSVLYLQVQFSSVAQSCPTLCNPMDCSTWGLPVHHQPLEVTQTHVHWVGDAIQPSHPLSSPSSPALNPSQHQGLFKWASSSHQVAKVLEFQLQHQSSQWIIRTDFL